MLVLDFIQQWLNTTYFSYSVTKERNDYCILPAASLSLS